MKPQLMARMIAVVFLAATPDVSLAQKALITGKITDARGNAVNGASAVLHETGDSVTVGSNGVFMFVVDSTLARGQMMNVRVRAGIWTIVKGARATPGTNTVDFQTQFGDRSTMKSVPAVTMKTVPSRSATKLPVTAQGRRDSTRGELDARVPWNRAQLSVTRGSQPAAVPIQADPFGRHLFTVEQVMQHQNALGLQDSQRAELQKAVESAQSQTLRFQWALAQETEKLSTQLSAETLDEQDVLAQTDRIFAIEREIKRAQMTLMIKIKNTLTAEQQERLRRLRGGDE